MSVLKHGSSFYKHSGRDIVLDNIRTMYEYGLIELGAYTNVSFEGSTSGYSVLQRSYDPRYGGEGRVYEGFGGSWVWEPDVANVASLDDPIIASGVWVNNVFQPSSGVGAYAHTLDFRNGRVIFDSAINSSDQVKCEYCIRDVEVYVANTPNWKRFLGDLRDRYYDIADHSPSGLTIKLKEDRVWLPCIVIDIDFNQSEGLQLGGGEKETFSLIYHIFSDYPFATQRISDVIANQHDRVIDLYNTNEIPPMLEYDGSVASGALTYKTIASRNHENFWTYGHINNTTSIGNGSILDLYISEMLQKIEVSRYLSTYS